MDLGFVEDAVVDGHAGVVFVVAFYDFGRGIDDGFVQVGFVGAEFCFAIFEGAFAFVKALPARADFADDAAVDAVTGHAAEHFGDALALCGAGFFLWWIGFADEGFWGEVDGDVAETGCGWVEVRECGWGEVGAVLGGELVAAFDGPADAHLHDGLHVWQGEEEAFLIGGQVNAAWLHPVLTGLSVEFEVRGAVVWGALIVPAFDAVIAEVGGGSWV